MYAMCVIQICFESIDQSIRFVSAYIDQSLMNNFLKSKIYVIPASAKNVLNISKHSLCNTA